MVHGRQENVLLRALAYKPDAQQRSTGKIKWRFRLVAHAMLQARLTLLRFKRGEIDHR